MCLTYDFVGVKNPYIVYPTIVRVPGIHSRDPPAIWSVFTGAKGQLLTSIREFLLVGLRKSPIRRFNVGTNVGRYKSISLRQFGVGIAPAR